VQTKLEDLCAALAGAINQVPETRMTREQKCRFEAAIFDAVALLLAEPERISRFHTPLQTE
jgi:hypothetical protein